MESQSSIKSMHRRGFLKQALQATVAFTIIPRFVLGKGYTAPSDQVTVGYIGTGKQARGLVRSFASRTQALAAADVDSQKLALFRQHAEQAYAGLKDVPKYEAIKGYGDFREIFERKDIDAVIIATPDHWHAVMTVMAANAKKHVYCEKPLAHSVEEGRAMANAVKKNKIVLQTGSMQRSSRNFRHACELVRNGYLGEIKEVLVNVGKAAIACDLPAEPVPSHLDWEGWVGPAEFHPFNAELSPPVEKDIFPNWRNYKEYGGGILSDWGAHMFDIAQWALGMDRTGPVKFVPPDGGQHKVLTMTYDNGVVMKHEDFGRGFGVRFIGSKGTLDISRGFLDSKPANLASAIIKPGEVQLYKSDDHYQDWIDCIKSGKEPICDVETGHRTSSVCCLANIAYWLNRPLEWNPKKEKFNGDRHANRLLEMPVRKPWSLK
jgi:predicted dehydrogenase